MLFWGRKSAEKLAADLQDQISKEQPRQASATADPPRWVEIVLALLLRRWPKANRAVFNSIAQACEGFPGDARLEGLQHVAGLRRLFAEYPMHGAAALRGYGE